VKALTVHAPWGWAIAYAGKNVENRSWKPPQSLIGQRIAIHQGKRTNEWARRFLANLCNPIVEGPFEPDIHLGCIVATAVVEGAFWQVAGCPQVRKRDPLPEQLLSRTSEYISTSVRNSRWYLGGVGWLLTDVIALPEPIPHKGAQGLWNVSPEALARIPEHAR
jgi:hypothetical protein